MQDGTRLPFTPFGHAVLVCEGVLARGILGDILGQFSNTVQCEGTLNRPAQLPDMVQPCWCSSCPNLWSLTASKPHSVCGMALWCLQGTWVSAKPSHHPTPAPHGDAVPALLQIRLIHPAPVVLCRHISQDQVGASKQPHGDRSPREDKNRT